MAVTEHHSQLIEDKIMETQFKFIESGALFGLIVGKDVLFCHKVKTLKGEDAYLYADPARNSNDSYSFLCEDDWVEMV